MNQTVKIFFSIILSGMLFSTQIQAEVFKGMYSYMADAPLFRDCQLQKRIPVALEGDNMSLERAYLKNRFLPGKALLVEVEGQIEPRPKMEGEGTQDYLVVDKFLSIKQQETCAGVVPPSPLKNTYWKLVEIYGQHLTDNPLWIDGQRKGGSKQREMHFIIKSGRDNLKGFAGCNYFYGPIKADKEHIKFGPFRTTRKACPNLKIESAFLTVLAQANRYTIKGEMLELFMNEKPVAKFVAIYF